MPITLKKEAFRLPSPKKTKLKPEDLSKLYGSNCVPIYEYSDKHYQGYKLQFELLRSRLLALSEDLSKLYGSNCVPIYEYSDKHYRGYELQFELLCCRLLVFSIDPSLTLTPKEKSENQTFTAKINRHKEHYGEIIDKLIKEVLFRSKQYTQSLYYIHRDKPAFFADMKYALEIILLKLFDDLEKLKSDQYSLNDKIDAISVLDQAITEAGKCDEGAYTKLTEMARDIQGTTGIANLVSEKLDADFTKYGSMHVKTQLAALDFELGKNNTSVRKSELLFQKQRLIGNEVHAPNFFKSIAFEFKKFPNDMPFKHDRYTPVITHDKDLTLGGKPILHISNQDNSLMITDFHANEFEPAFDQMFNAGTIVQHITHYIAHAVLTPYRRLQKQVDLGDSKKITQASNETYEQINLRFKELGLIKDDNGHEADFFDYFDETQNRWQQKSEMEVLYWAHVYACRGLQRDNLIEGIEIHSLIETDYWLATDGTSQWIEDSEGKLVTLKDFLKAITPEQFSKLIPGFKTFGIVHSLLETIRTDYPGKFTISDELKRNLKTYQLEYNIYQCCSSEPFFAFDSIDDLDRLLKAANQVNARPLLIKALSYVPRSKMQAFFTSNLMNPSTRFITKQILNNLKDDNNDDLPDPSLYISQDFLYFIYENQNDSDIDSYIPDVWFGKAPQKIPRNFSQMVDADRINALLPPSTLEGLFELYPNMLDRYLQAPKDVAAALDALDAIANMEHRKNLLHQLIMIAAPKIKAMFHEHQAELAPLLYAYTDLCEALTGVKPFPQIDSPSFKNAYNIVTVAQTRYKTNAHRDLKIESASDIVSLYQSCQHNKPLFYQAIVSTKLTPLLLTGLRTDETVKTFLFQMDKEDPKLLMKLYKYDLMAFELGRIDGLVRIDINDIPASWKIRMLNDGLLKLPQTTQELLSEYLSKESPDNFDRTVFSRFLDSPHLPLKTISLIDIMDMLATPAMREVNTRDILLGSCAIQCYLKRSAYNNIDSKIPSALIDKLYHAINNEYKQGKSLDELLEKYHLPPIAKDFADQMHDPHLFLYWLRVFSTKYFEKMGVIPQGNFNKQELPNGIYLVDYQGIQWFENQQGQMIPPLARLLPRQNVPHLRSFECARMLDTAFEGKNTAIRAQRNDIKYAHNATVLQNKRDSYFTHDYMVVIENLDDLTYVLNMATDNTMFNEKIRYQSRDLIEKILTDGLNNPATYHQAATILYAMGHLSEKWPVLPSSVSNLIHFFSLLKENQSQETPPVDISAFIEHAIESHPDTLTAGNFIAYYNNNAALRSSENVLILFEKLIKKSPEQKIQAILCLLPTLEPYYNYHYYLSLLPAHVLTEAHKKRDEQLRIEHNSFIIRNPYVSTTFAIENLDDILEIYKLSRLSTQEGVAKKRLAHNKKKIQQIFQDSLLKGDISEQKKALNVIDSTEYMSPDFIDALLALPPKSNPIARIPPPWKNAIPLEALKKLITNYDDLQRFNGYTHPVKLFRNHSWIIDALTHDQTSLDKIPITALFSLPRNCIRQSELLKKYLLEKFDGWISTTQNTTVLTTILVAMNINPSSLNIKMAPPYNQRFLRGLFLRHIGVQDPALVAKSLPDRTEFVTYHDPANDLYVDWIEPQGETSACVIHPRNYDGPCYNPVVIAGASFEYLHSEQFRKSYINKPNLQAFLALKDKPSFRARFSAHLATYIDLNPRNFDELKRQVNDFWGKLPQEKYMPEDLLGIIPTTHPFYSGLAAAIDVVTRRQSLTQLAADPALFFKTLPMIRQRVISLKTLENLIENFPHDTETQKEVAKIIVQNMSLIQQQCDDPFPFYVIARHFTPNTDTLLTNLRFHEKSNRPAFVASSIKFLTMLAADNPSLISTILERVHVSYWPDFLNQLGILPNGTDFSWLAPQNPGENLVAAKQKITGIFHSYKRHESWSGWFNHLIGQSQRPDFIYDIEPICAGRQLNFDQLFHIKQMLIQYFARAHHTLSMNTDTTRAIIEGTRVMAL